MVFRVLIYCVVYSTFFNCANENSQNSDPLYSYVNLEKIQGLSKSGVTFYLDSLDNELNKTRNDSIFRNKYFEIANQYFDNGQIEKSRATSRKLLDYSIKANDSLHIAKSLFYIADSFRISNKDSAYFYYFKAEKIYGKQFDFTNAARMQFGKAYVLFYDGNYIACEIQLSKALQNLKKSDDYFLLYSCNSLLGNCLEKIGDFDEALVYHKNALKIIENLPISKRDKDIYEVSTVINISNLYDIQHQYDKSILNLQGILNEDLRNSNPLSYARLLSNLAYSKFKNNEYDGVENMFLESIKIADSLGYDSDLLYKYIYFGEYYASKYDTLAATHYIQLANNLAYKNGNTNEVLTTLKILANIDKENALKYTSEYITISDNVQALQKKTRNKYARIEYETTRIEDANKTLSRNNVIIIIVALGLITLLIIFIIVRYIKFKNQELQFLRKQEKASEDVFNLLTEQQQRINQAKEAEKSKIAQELHDGIMNALYGIRLNLGFFNSKQDTEAIVKRRIYIEELKKVETDIRSISHDLSRNTLFDNSDFNMLLEGLVDNQQGISTTRFTYINATDSDWTDIPNLFKINLYRIIQESILNVNKYAQAQNCIISFQRVENTIRILIQDDGVGFDTTAKKNGIGHSNMNSRIKSLDGKIQFTSQPSKGTTIEIIVDITSALNSNSKRKK